MKSNLRNLLLIISAIFILSSGISCILDMPKATGLLLVLGLIGLALAVRGFQKLKGFSYTLWIFTSVTAC